MYDKSIIIKDYPGDVYRAVGKIIEDAQDWEQRCKELTIMLKIPVKKVSNSSLNKLNEALKKGNQISKKDFENLKEVIDKRNYINHDFFLKDFKMDYDDYNEHLEHLEAYLNEIRFLIHEATDFINNKIDLLNGDSIMRPTVFDK